MEWVGVGVDIEVSVSGRGSVTEGGVSLSFFGGGRVPTVFSSSRGDMETSKGKPPTHQVLQGRLPPIIWVSHSIKMLGFMPLSNFFQTGGNTVPVTWTHMDKTNGWGTHVCRRRMATHL